MIIIWRKDKEEKESWNRFYIIPIGFIDSRIESKFKFPLLCKYSSYYQEEIVSNSKIKGKIIVLRLKNSQGISLPIHKCLNINDTELDKDEDKYLVATSIRLNLRQTPKSKQIYGVMEVKEREELKNSPHLLKEIWDRYNIQLFYKND